METIIVDGQVLAENGKAIRFDEAAMQREVQKEGERMWQSVPEWHWTGKDVEEIVPPSYPVRGEMTNGKQKHDEPIELQISTLPTGFLTNS